MNDIQARLGLNPKKNYKFLVKIQQNFIEKNSKNSSEYSTRTIGFSSQHDRN